MIFKDVHALRSVSDIPKTDGVVGASCDEYVFVIFVEINRANLVKMSENIVRGFRVLLS